MSEHPTNLAASIHARLANEARKVKRPFSEELQYYGMERFLYRLFKSKYSSSFILKGGLVLYVLDLPLRRPTKDIDFLALVENSKDTIFQVVKAAINAPVVEDGVRYDIGTLVIEETQVDADQKGIRLNSNAAIDYRMLPSSPAPRQLSCSFFFPKISTNFSMNSGSSSHSNQFTTNTGTA